MKTIYLLIVAVTVTFTMNAQTRTAMVPVYMDKTGIPVMLSLERSISDTLVGPSWTNIAAIGPALIPAVGGGYVSGNNGYGDKQKAQAFTNTLGNIEVDGAIIWFRIKQHDASAIVSKVQVSEYSLDGGGTTNSGHVTTAPGTVNAITDVLFSDIDTGGTFATGANTIMFASPVATSADFAIGVNFSTLGAGDTVGMISSSQPVGGPPGDAMGTEKAWEQWSTGAWHTIRQVWGLDIDLFIWALVDSDPSGVQEIGYINGVRLFQNQPNPACNTALINYELETTTDNVSILIFDVTGKLIKTYHEGNKLSGKHSIIIDTSNLDAGIYYYALTAGKGRVAKKMVITK